MAAAAIYERDVPAVILALTALESMRGATIASDITAEEHAMILAARRDTHVKFLENRGIAVKPTPRDAPNVVPQMEDPERAGGTD